MRRDVTASSLAITLSDASIERHSQSFSLAAKLLPRARRQTAEVLYAWCRRADDLVDGVAAGEAGQGEAQRACRELRRELLAVYSGQRLSDPTLRELAHTFSTHSIPMQYPRDLLAGMAMDADGYRYATLDDLLLYAYRVAGTVGLMMCHVLGVRSQRALRHAAHLGMAMQLTNVCRDVLEDWQRGRLYLPATLLEEHGVTRLHERLGEAFPLAARAACAATIRRLLALSDRYYASGDAGLAYLDLRTAFSVDAARRVYSTIGNEIRKHGCDPTAGRAVVPQRTKLVLVSLACLNAAKSLPMRLIRPRAARSSLHCIRYPQDVVFN